MSSQREIREAYGHDPNPEPPADPNDRIDEPQCDERGNPVLPFQRDSEGRILATCPSCSKQYVMAELAASAADSARSGPFPCYVDAPRVETTIPQFMIDQLLIGFAERRGLVPMNGGKHSVEWTRRQKHSGEVEFFAVVVWQKEGAK